MWRLFRDPLDIDARQKRACESLLGALRKQEVRERSIVVGKSYIDALQRWSEDNKAEFRIGFPGGARVEIGHGLHKFDVQEIEVDRSSDFSQAREAASILNAALNKSPMWAWMAQARILSYSMERTANPQQLINVSQVKHYLGFHADRKTKQVMFRIPSDVHLLPKFEMKDWMVEIKEVLDISQAVKVASLGECKKALAGGARVLQTHPYMVPALGVPFAKAMWDEIKGQYPGTRLILNCGEDAGATMVAIKAGFADIRFTGDEKARAKLQELAQEMKATLHG